MQQQRRFNPTASPLDQRLIQEAQRLRKDKKRSASVKRRKVPIQGSNAIDLSDEPGKRRRPPA
jgi:hypothetical protein